MKFNELKFKERNGFLGGIQAIHFFPNGYGVSIVKGMGTYGADEGLYELAVLKGEQGNSFIHYKNPVADGDVVGWLSEEEVEVCVNKVISFQKEEF